MFYRAFLVAVVSLVICFLSCGGDGDGERGDWDTGDDGQGSGDGGGGGDIGSDDDTDDGDETTWAELCEYLGPCVEVFYVSSCAGVQECRGETDQERIDCCNQWPQMASDAGMPDTIIYCNLSCFIDCVPEVDTCAAVMDGTVDACTAPCFDACAAGD